MKTVNMSSVASLIMIGSLIIGMVIRFVIL